MILFLVVVVVFFFAESSFTCQHSSFYSPLDQPGPFLNVPRRNLSNALKCCAGNRTDQRWILLLPGSSESIEELFGWNWIPLLRRQSSPFCTLELPDYGLGDLQIAAEYVVYAIRRVYRRAMKEKQQGLSRLPQINEVKRGRHITGDIVEF